MCSCVKKGQLHRRTARRLKEAILPLHLALVRSHLEYYVPFWASQYTNDIDIMNCV